MFKLLWTIRTWFMGVSVILMLPFYILGFLLFSLPLIVGRKFDNEREV